MNLRDLAEAVTRQENFLKELQEEEQDIRNEWDKEENQTDELHKEMNDQLIFVLRRIQKVKKTYNEVRKEWINFLDVERRVEFNNLLDF